MDSSDREKKKSICTLTYHTYTLPSTHQIPSYRIPKLRQILQNLLPLIRLLIIRHERRRQRTHKNQNHNLRPHGHAQTGNILRRILAPENRTPYNASQSTSTNEGSATKRPLPLPTDIVCLIRQYARHVCV